MIVKVHSHWTKKLLRRKKDVQRQAAFRYNNRISFPSPTTTCFHSFLFSLIHLFIVCKFSPLKCNQSVLGIYFIIFPSNKVWDSRHNQSDQMLKEKVAQSLHKKLCYSYVFEIAKKVAKHLVYFCMKICSQ